jgi:hypothetical protein
MNKVARVRASKNNLPSHDTEVGNCISWTNIFLCLQRCCKVMMFSHISHIYKKAAELVSTENDNAYGLHMTTVQSLGDCACHEKWSSHQRIGVIAQDSANIKTRIEHDYKLNKLKGGEKTHSIITLTQMFQAFVQEVKDATNETKAKDNVTTISAQQQNIFILENLTLAEEHLVFKYSIMDPNIKCSKVVVSVNMNKVTPAIITSIMTLLRDTLPIFGLEVGMATSNAAGCNWVSCQDLTTHTFCIALPHQLVDKYPTINFNVMCLAKHLVTKHWIIFIADMPHLTKNIVTCLEKFSLKNSKRNLKFGEAPVNLNMIEDIWMRLGGASGQLQSTKLTRLHFEKDLFS